MLVKQYCILVILPLYEDNDRISNEFISVQLGAVSGTCSFVDADRNDCQIECIAHYCVDQIVIC